MLRAWWLLADFVLDVGRGERDQQQGDADAVVEAALYVEALADP